VIYLRWRSAEYTEYWQADASKDELEPSTLFAQDNEDSFACYLQTAEYAEY
jgi:hypothetical protein